LEFIMKRVVTMIILMLAVAGVAAAQAVPALVNYQGRLTDAAGWVPPISSR